jgi:tRNA(Ile)-lysidine synthase
MLLKSIENTLAKYNVTNVLVGFSGGVDSTVLISLLNQIKGVTVRAVYVNHGVSKESDDWETFCKTFCNDLEIEFHAKKVDCSTKSRESFEAVARKERYGVYKDLLQKNEHLCLGQHSDDQVETVLLQLLRGTGLAGLSGMPLCNEYENGFILRPFLDTDTLTVTKEEIEKYANENNIKHITDESNFSNDYRRNFLRNKIIPELKNEFGNINKSITRTSKHCAETAEYINSNVRNINSNVFHTQILQDQSYFEKKLSIQKWIKNNNKLALSSTNLEQLVSFITNYKTDSNFKLESKEYTIRHYNHEIYLLDKSYKKSYEQNFSKLGRVPVVLNAVIVFKNDINEKLTFEGKDLNIKKFFNRLRLPLWDRESIPIYLLGNQIIAIGNYIVSKDFKNTEEKYFSFEIIK